MNVCECGHDDAVHEPVIVKDFANPERTVIYAVDFFEDVPEQLAGELAAGRGFMWCAMCEDTCGPVGEAS